MHKKAGSREQVAVTYKLWCCEEFHETLCEYDANYVYSFFGC